MKHHQLISRKEKGLSASHPSRSETLTPNDISLDERRKVVVVLIKRQITEPPSGKLVIEKRYYHLIVDEENTLKIQKMLFFFEILPPGKNTFDLIKRDPSMEEFFGDSN